LSKNETTNKLKIIAVLKVDETISHAFKNDVKVLDRICGDITARKSSQAINLTNLL